MDRQSANERVASLFRWSAQYDEVVTRDQIVAAAGTQLDPLKRVRRNGGARDLLEREGIEIVWLGGDEWKGRSLAQPSAGEGWPASGERDD